MALPCVGCGREQSAYLTTRHISQLTGMLSESAADLCQAGAIPGAYKGRMAFVAHPFSERDRLRESEANRTSR